MNLSLLKPVYLLVLLLVPAVFLLFIRFSLRKAPVRIRKIITLIIRALVVLLLALSLGGLSLSHTQARVNVLFLLDVSDSINEIAGQEALSVVHDLLTEMGEADTAGVIVFGRNASVEAAPTSHLERIILESEIETNATDIARALKIALASFQGKGENRIVLLSDGNENRGRALDIAGVARASGVKIISIPIRSDFLIDNFSSNEVYIKDILAPFQVKVDQLHDFTVLVHSLKSTPARLTIFRDGRYAGEEEVFLKPGKNSFTYTAGFDTNGLHQYEAIIEAPVDTLPENNCYQSLVKVIGRPSVLYISQPGEQSESFLNALTAQGLDVSVGEIMDIPESLSGFFTYDTIIFDNIPAFDLSIAKMDLIERYVRHAGGGFIMLGGENSFGVGGYYKTPIERALPVDVDVTSSLKIPNLTMIMVVDKSGSMGGSTESGETKLDLVKEAVFSAVELLNPLYQVGLLAFDAEYEWAVPIMSAGERGKLIDNLYRLSSGGGTKLYEALEEGIGELRKTPSAVKHIIVLSDGLTNVGDFPTLVKQAAADRVTVSTVAVGRDADRGLMQDIAEWGGGRSYFTDDLNSIPRIFAAEAIIVSRGLITEETFFPGVASFSEILSGIELSGLPPLHGFVHTYLKSGAQQILSAPSGEPVLAVRRYGIGRTAAFTSDFKGKWGKDWLSWDSFSQLTAQLIRWTERVHSPQKLNVSFSHEGGTRTILVEVLDFDDRFINLLDLKGTVIFPNQQALEINLEQIAPGSYSASFDAEDAGPYYIILYGENDEYSIQPETFGMTIPYPREYMEFGANIFLLEKLAERTHGELIDMGNGESLHHIFASAETGYRTPKSLWRLLAVIALLLFVLEIGVRKIALPAGLLARCTAAWGMISSRIRKRLTGKQQNNLSYQELSAMISAEHRRMEEQRQKRDIVDKDVYRLFMTGLRRRS